MEVVSSEDLDARMAILAANDMSSDEDDDDDMNEHISHGHVRTKFIFSDYVAAVREIDLAIKRYQAQQHISKSACVETLSGQTDASNVDVRRSLSK